MTAPVDITYSPAPDVPFVGSTETFFNYDSRSQAATAGQSLVRGHISANVGHIPAGQLPVLMHSDGSTPVGNVIQWDKLSTASPDGSIIAASFRMMLPETISSLGSTATYKWGLAASTRDTTPNVTTAQIIANTDLKVKAHGADFGSDTFTVSLNDILQNFTGGVAPIDFGANPLGGWEITEQGPIVTSVYAWRFMKRDSDGGSHRWVRLSFYWSFLSATSGNIASFGWMRAEHPNIVGPHPSGTVGPTSYPLYFRGEFDLYNGSTLVTGSDFTGSVGGSNDPATLSIAASSLGVSNGTLTGLGGLAQNLYYQVTSTGTPPGGLTSGGIYVWGNGTAFYNSRNDVGNVASPVTITDVGTGTHTFTALGCVAGGCGFFMRTTDGSEEPIWFGTSARPTKVDRAEDLTYRLRGARVTFPRDPSACSDQNITAPPGDLGFGGGRPNAVPAVPWDINTTGDGQNDLRIGEEDMLNTLSTYLPQHVALTLASRSLMLCWADYQCHYIDEARGRRTVGNDGTYACLGASRTDMDYLTSQGHAGFIGVQTNGYVFRYNAYVDGSHMPTFGKRPYLRNGDDIALEIVFDQIGSLAMGYNRHVNAPSGTTYHSVLCIPSDQARSPGWALHLGNYVRKVAPDQHPESAHYRDNVKSSAACYADFAHNNPANAKACGIVIPQMGTYVAGGAQNWMNHIYHGALLMAYWMGLDAAWKTGVDETGYIAFSNMYLPEFGGRMFEAGCTHLLWCTDYSNNPSACVAGGIAGLWAASNDQRYNQTYTGPDKWQGLDGEAVLSEDNTIILFAGQTGGNAHVTDWGAFPCMTIEMADVCGIKNARPVLARWRARVNRNGGYFPAPYLAHAPKSWAT